MVSPDRQPATIQPIRWFPGAAPYVMPLVAMLACTGLANALPAGQAHFYLLKVVSTCAVLWAYRRHYVEIARAGPGAILLGALVGLVLIALWVGLDPYYPQSLAELKSIAGEGWRIFFHKAKVNGQFDPYAPAWGLSPPVIIAFRVFGAVVVAPLAEELFYRAWLLRYLIREDFRSVALGTFTWQSFFITTALFAFSHHEWLAGLICGAALNGLLYWRRNLTVCIIAHAAANLGLAAWVLGQGAWQFW